VSFARWIAAALVIGWCVSPTMGQQPCPMPPVTPPAETSMFSAQQEMDLGEIVAEHVEHNYDLVSNDALNKYLQSLVDRLAKFAPTDLRLRVRLVDIPEVNAYTLPGGRIYVTRKLIVFLRSEDELAGVLGHEIGHAVSRDPVLTVSHEFNRILNVTEVGDRHDIYEKYQRLIDRWAKKGGCESCTRKDRQERNADLIGLYLMARAGYDPQASVAAWDRMAETKGKPSGWLGELFGASSPEAHRLHDLMKTAADMPPECRGHHPGQIGDYWKWRNSVIEQADRAAKEHLHNVLLHTHLQPPLRADITHLQFSPDGKFALAQDENSIYLLSREPFAYLFRIDAPAALPAHFTPNSRNLVFHDRKLRVEKWDIVSQKRTRAYEVALAKSCLQAALSPDGAVLACLDESYTLKMIDPSDSTVLFENKNFYVPWIWDLFAWSSQPAGTERELSFLGMEFSPDGRYFIAARGDTSIAIDTGSFQRIDLNERIKGLLPRSFTFVGPHRLVGIKGLSGNRASVVEFPSGKVVIKDLLVGGASIAAATHGDYLLLRPVKDYPVGVLDPMTNKLVGENRTPALDVFDQTGLGELRNGEVALFSVGPHSSPEPLGHVILPESRLGILKAFDVSGDFKQVALSQSVRGAVWDLDGKAPPLLVRDFRGAWLPNDGSAYLDFPAFEKTGRLIARIDLAHKQVVDQRDIIEDPPDPKSKPVERVAAEEPDRKYHQWEVWQSGPYLITLKPKARFDVRKDVEMEVADTRSSSVLWSRHFPKERPTVDVLPQEDEMILRWATSDGMAKDLINGSAQLKEKLSALEERKEAYLLQVLDARNGTLNGNVLVDTGKGSFQIESTQSSGDWLVVLDNRNRALLYSAATGEVKGKFFGSYVALSEKAGLLAVENTPGQITLYSLADSSKRDEFTFPEPVIRLRFSPDGKQLFALTRDQSVYVLGVTP
jgi:hypothetical protein